MSVLKPNGACARAVLIAGLAAAGFLPTLTAWNETGHRIVAAVAYDNLTPQSRARVDELIRRHPDYNALFLKGAPTDPSQRARAAFIAAAYWPDTIRNDPRFYDDTRRDTAQTPLLPGFPDMGRHTNWHYVDFNFSDDGTPIPLLETPNALTELTRLIPLLGKPTGENSADRLQQVYALPWLLHLAGDVHNPLHTVSRYSHGLPKGDRGGNDVFVKPGPNMPGINLHAYWDNLGGTDSSSAYVDEFARQIKGEYKANNTGMPPEINPQVWVVEEFYNARNQTYKFGNDNGTKEKPVGLKDAYQKAAKSLARKQLYIAGLRLAAVLNTQMK